MNTSSAIKLSSLALFASSLTGQTFADTHPFEVYTKLNIGVVDESDTDGYYPNIVSNGSWFGIKGDAKMSENSSFIYQYEVGIPAELDFSEDLSRRDQYAGIGTTWGNFYIGRRNTEFKMAKGKIDYGFTNYGGTIRRVTLGNDRENYMAGYETGELNGFRFGFQTITSKKEYDSEYSTSLSYKGNGWAAAYAHSENMETSIGYGILDRISLQYFWTQFELGVMAQASESSEGADWGDAYVLSAAWNIAPRHKIWTVNGWSTEPAGLAKSWVDDTGTLVDDSTLYSIGYDWKFNNSTTFHTYYSSLDATNIDGTEKSKDTFSVGFQYNFSWGI